MKNIDYSAPKSVEEAVEILKGADQGTQIIAGGTDIIIQMNRNIKSPQKVVDIKKISELKYVKEEKDFIKIGALTPFHIIENSEIINKKAKALAIACSEVGSPQIRNLGTIGGNIVNASAAGDSIAALMALDAYVTLTSSREERIMSLEKFYQGDGDCQIRKDEILTEIFFKTPSENAVTSFRKLGKRKALAIVVISIGALIEKNEENICTKAHIALGAISRYPVRVREAEEILINKELNEENINKCIEKLSQVTDSSVQNSPFEDLALYKRESMKGISTEVFDHILMQFKA